MKMVAALVKGGVFGIEITYTTPSAVEVACQLNKKYGDEILLGMGTLTQPEQAAEAHTAGAQFLVSPICEQLLAQAMSATDLTVMIGAFTPTEVHKAYRLGSDVVKIFPGSVVGPGYLKSLHGPFPEIRMMPTGGVDLKNIADWFTAGAFAIGAGSKLCPGTWAKEGRFGDITERASQFVRAVADARSSLNT
jgi:2-dehydro-3-deoxyphosphogluconate aldolase/(4S)-4-hydroxy-2-oxoglutarate aldolase